MDNKNQEPIVLGTVKKGKTGKPILAILLIIFIGLLIYFLPVIQELFKNESIVNLIKNGELIDFIKNGGKIEKKVNNNKQENNLVEINNNAVLSNDNIVISNISLVNNVLTYSINSKNATYDAKEDNLYLRIYENKDKVVFTKSLDEHYTMTASVVKENISSLNNNATYYISLEVIDPNEIEDIVLSSDESGLASITCTLDNDEFEYIFSKKLLVKIEREFSYRYNSNDNDDYSSKLSKYRDMGNEMEKYGAVATVTEDINGFTYKEEIDLSKVDADKLDSNYYKYNTEAKVVKFKQEAKGFDCE